MSAPPGIAPDTDTAVSRSTESHPSRRRIRANIAKVLEDNGQEVVGARLNRLVLAYTTEGVSNLEEVPGWLKRRGDIVEQRSRVLAHDTSKDWSTRP